MLDRASTFAHPEIVELLKTRFVPVALDQAYQRRQQDTEGDFYRKIAGQSSRNDFDGTTQGFYIATAAGDLLLYNNNRDPDKLLRLMREKLTTFDLQRQLASTIVPLVRQRVDARFNVSSPEKGLVLRVNAKVLGGYAPTANRWKQIFQSALSRDNLWITAEEHDALVNGEIPSSLQKRIARFHLVDNTRGEPPMWREDEIKSISIQIKGGLIQGHARLATSDGRRGYTADLRGKIEVMDGRVVQFDLISYGQFWGDGPYTRGAPEGKFPLGISFSLADGSDVADAIPPQGSRGWVDGYLR